MRLTKINISSTTSLFEDYTSGDAWNYIMAKFGDKESTNPFLNFKNLYIAKNNNWIDDNSIRHLLNLYASNFILKEDLIASTEEGKDSILFNPSLWKVNEKDLDFIIKAYYWLGEPSKVRRATKNDEILRNFNFNKNVTFSNISNNDILKLRDLIIFKNGNPNNDINDKEYISKVLESFQQVGKSTPSNKSTRDGDKYEDIISIDIDKLNDLSYSELEKLKDYFDTIVRER